MFPWWNLNWYIQCSALETEVYILILGCNFKWDINRENPFKYGEFSQKYFNKLPHILLMRAWYWVFFVGPTFDLCCTSRGIILCMRPANERWRYSVAHLSLAGCIHRMIPASVMYMYWGPFYDWFFHRNSNLIEISFCSHPSSTDRKEILHICHAM